MNAQQKDVIIHPTADARIKEEVAEILGPFNTWVTGVAVGHEPTSHECFRHWLRHGGLKRFRRTHKVAA